MTVAQVRRMANIEVVQWQAFYRFEEKMGARALEKAKG